MGNKKKWRFLTFGLITTLSITSISTLTISCGKKTNTNNEDTTKPNNEQILEQSLNNALKNFNIRTKTNSSNIYAKEITNENQLKQYVEFEGKAENFEYIFVSSNPINKTQLEVEYTIKIQNKQQNKRIILDGFRDIDSIDYDINNVNDFFKIALNKEHLNTIAFFAQEYNFYTEGSFTKWTLALDKEDRFKATKTNKYFMLDGSKYSIYEIEFVNTDSKKPIIAELASFPDWGSIEAVFTEKGKTKNPFLFAIKEN